MCIAMLQNQAKNRTCHSVNFVLPACGSPPVHNVSLANVQNWLNEPISAPVSSINCLSAIRPKAMNTRIIHGAAMFANRATASYPQAATTAMTLPTAATARIQPRLFGRVSSNLGIGNSNHTPTAVAETVIIAPAKKQNMMPLARLYSTTRSRPQIRSSW